MDITKLYNTACFLAREGGDMARSAASRISVNYKGGDVRNIVTNIDTEIDIFLTQHIRSNFPEATIYSEESGGVLPSKGVAWVFDPIDGSSNYARGIPHYATVVSVFFDGQLLVGAVFNPVTNECFSVREGKSFLNDVPLTVSPVRSLQDAYVDFHPGRKAELIPWAGSLKMRLLRSAKKSLNLGSSALDICYLACGRLDVVVYGTFTTLDVAAAVHILRTAHGEMYKYGTETPVLFSSDSQPVIATTSGELLADFYHVCTREFITPE